MMECRWRHVAREMPLGEFGRGIGFGLFVFDSGRGKHWVDSSAKDAFTFAVAIVVSVSTSISAWARSLQTHKGF